MMCIRWVSGLVLGSVLLASAATRAGEPIWPVVRNGQLEHEGRPYRGVGVNAFDLFARTLERGEDTSYRESLHALREAGIPFARFMACGFWPRDARLYLENPAEYFRRLDAVVKAAEEEQVGLIPSLFWHLPTVPDLVGEPMDQLGNPESKTIAMVKKYTREVVERYRQSTAIWGWELGNEYSLAADLPNASKLRPPIVPDLGTPATRSERDEVRSEHLQVVFRAFAETVRALDPDRLVTTGNAVPRSSSWHNTRERSWKADTAEQFAEILRRDNPDPYNSLSVHVYPQAEGPYAAGAKDLEALLAQVRTAAESQGKVLFIGEFGVQASADAGADRAAFDALLGAIERQHVPLAALWVYDFKGQDREWNATFQNARRYQLEGVAEANRRSRVETP